MSYCVQMQKTLTSKRLLLFLIDSILGNRKERFKVGLGDEEDEGEG